MNKSRRNGNITVRKDAPGGYIGSVLIFSCIGVAYLRSGSDQVFGGVSFVWKDLVGIAILT